MYSVYVKDDMNKLYYIIFETYSSAVNAINTFNATSEKEYTILDYIESGTVTTELKGDLINQDAIDLPFTLSYYEQYYIISNNDYKQWNVSRYTAI